MFVLSVANVVYFCGISKTWYRKYVGNGTGNNIHLTSQGGIFNKEKDAFDKG